MEAGEKMRDLTCKQKRLLDKWYEWNKEFIQIGLIWFEWSKCDFFSLELFEQLEAINDTEILSQNVNRYITDKA